jgi:hypothetical protein
VGGTLRRDAPARLPVGVRRGEGRAEEDAKGDHDEHTAEEGQATEASRPAEGPAS